MDKDFLDSQDASGEETPEQRMEREIRVIKDDYSRKSLKVTTSLIRMKKLVGCKSRDEILEMVIEIVAKGVNADRVQVLLLDVKNRRLFPVKAKGMAEKDFPPFSFSIDEPSILSFLINRSLESPSETVGAFDLKACGVDSRTHDLIGKGVLTTIIAAPILVFGSVFGIVNVEKLKGKDYSPDDLNLVAFCADIAGLVLQNQRIASAALEEAEEEKGARLDQAKQNEELKASMSRILSPSIAHQILHCPPVLPYGDLFQGGHHPIHQCPPFHGNLDAHEPDRFGPPGQ